MKKLTTNKRISRNILSAMRKFIKDPVWHAILSKKIFFEINDAKRRKQGKSIFELMFDDESFFFHTKEKIESLWVVCDHTNNTSKIIDKNKFITDIYVNMNTHKTFAFRITIMPTKLGQVGWKTKLEEIEDEN